jgi:hypothetical protein
MQSVTYGRLGLAVAQHPGSTVACTQAEALVRAAERRLGRWPWRRTDLLQQRISTLHVGCEPLIQQVQEAQQQLTQAEAALTAVHDLVTEAQQQVQVLQIAYDQQVRPAGPYSQLTKAKTRWAVYQRRQTRREHTVSQVRQWLTRRQAALTVQEAELGRLEQRLQQLEADNRANTAPMEACLRLDAGFDTPENVAGAIELGYEIYGKPYGTWLLNRLQDRLTPQTTWQRVGQNAEMVAWPAVQLADCPYPLDLALERFHTGTEVRMATLLHFGPHNVTADLAQWFHTYNARQTIEAGNKEGKQVFEIHHLKVRTPPALQLQEQCALFAANFVRFAAVWLAEQCPQLPEGWKESTHPHVKQQVKGGAHTSAWVTWLDQDCLLTFEEFSIYAGRSLTVKRLWAFQPVLPFAKSAFFEPF